MIPIFEEFKRQLSKKSIKTQNSKLDKVIQKFSFDIFIDDKEDLTLLRQKSNGSHIIIIDKYIENESRNNYGDDFYIICFEYSLFIIQSKKLSNIIPLLVENKESAIFCYSKPIKRDILQIAGDKKINFSKEKFFNKIPNCLDAFKTNIGSCQRANEIKKFWITISRSVFGFLLMKSYINSKIDRSDQNQFKSLFQKNSNTFELHKNDYIELMPLGSGSSSNAQLIYHIEHEKIYALKLFYNEKERDKLYERELYNYKNLSHPFFPRFYGTLQGGSYKGLVIEYIEGETLYKQKDISIHDRVFLTLKILQIIEYIHEHEFIHRDLKTDNFIISRDRNIFLIDFNRMIQITAINESNEITNDLTNTPPENAFSYSSDIYFLAKNIFKYLFPEEFCTKYKALLIMQETIAKCTNENPEFRQNISELVNNYYLMIGYLYYNGQGVEQDYKKAKEYYELSAQQNNSNALNNLGLLYRNGYGVERDYKKAKEYYELSAQQNNSNALNNLGHLYRNGYGVERDYKKAKEYYELSAQRNNSNALNNLGDLYYDGHGVGQDYKKAKKYYELSAQQNNSNALNNLGLLYRNGYGVGQDYKKAKEYYELSAQQNNSNALNYLGDLYYDGYGVEQDYKKAKEYYELSAQQNNSNALNNLGDLYYDGHGVEQDYKKAKEYYELSAQQNNSFALFNMAWLYKKEKEYLKAKKYYELLAQENNSESICKIGNLYLKGRGVDKNYLKAKEYYEESANMNNSNALYKLGNLYYHGLGVKQDINKAMKYYELSRRQGNLKAPFEIGTLFFEGKRIEQNYNKAKNYYEISVYNNNPDGLFFLGVFYSRGDILEVNIRLAVQYFLKSIEIHYDQVRVYNIVDNYYFIKNIYNNYFYHSHNDLGLIYLTIYEDIENATKYIKESAFGEYLFGQNNFGLLNEIYLNELGNAEYMYQRSSKHNFALAFYNLGRFKEKETQKTTEERKGKENQDSEEYIDYYKKASDSEDCPLIFRNRQFYDKQLEISKTFIICMTNLKLCEYYFNKGDLPESKKYFTRSLNKLLNDKEHSTFSIKIDQEKAENFFIYLNIFILRFPLFNLSNQPNLNLCIEKIFNTGLNHDIPSLSEKNFTEENIADEYSNEMDEMKFIVNQEMIEKIKERKNLENKGIKKEIRMKEQQICNDKNDNMNLREEKISIDDDKMMVAKYLNSSFRVRNIKIFFVKKSRRSFKL